MAVVPETDALGVVVAARVRAPDVGDEVPGVEVAVRKPYATVVPAKATTVSSATSRARRARRRLRIITPPSGRW
jgi:hypothetical protein